MIIISFCNNKKVDVFQEGENQIRKVYKLHNSLKHLLKHTYANLVILATPVRVLGLQVVSLGHLGGFVAF